MVFLFSSMVFAETIVLKSGSVFEGKIITRDENRIEVSFDGMLVTYWMDEVEAIRASQTDTFVSSSNRLRNDSLSSDPAKKIEEMAVMVSGLDLDEMVQIREILQEGLKDNDSVEILLQKYKADLDRFKKTYVHEFQQSPSTLDLKAVASRSGNRNGYLQLLNLARLVLFVKLFELDHDRPLTSLSELVPDYIDKVLTDDFSGGDLRTYLFSDQKRMICSVGPDITDDQGKELLNSQDFWRGKEVGDICFSFK